MREEKRASGIRLRASGKARAKAALMVVGAALVAAPALAEGEPNFPPPEFTQGYQFPPLWLPGAREGWLTWVDLGVLLATLCLAAFLALKKRSRRDVAVLAVFSLAYFGLLRHGCVCAIGAIQNVALALADKSYALPLAAGVFFALPLMFALVFGRVFCSSVCPLGALQELVLLRPVKTPRWLDHALGMLPHVYLGLGVLFAATASDFIICRWDPFVLFFRLNGSAVMLVVGAAFVLLSTVVGRPYCRYLCPYSVLLRLAAPLAKWRVSTTPGGCVVCHLCAEACPYGAILPPTLEGQKGARREGKARLAWLVVALPLLVAGSAGLVRLGSPVLARANAKVRLAERVWLEQQGGVQERTEATEAVETLGIPSSDIFREAGEIKKRFDLGSWFLGGWVGLVFGLRMIGLTIRRRRDEYQVDPAACVACGRCYAACPVGREDLSPEAIAALQAAAPGEARR